MRPNTDYSLESLFWSRVQRTETCWLWTGTITSGGYGHLAYGSVDGKRVLLLAHRISWQIHYGPIPAGLFVLHNCPGGDNPACVRPSHLWLGTHADNMRDRIDKGKYATGDQHHARRNPSSVARGVRAGTAKLTENDVRSIRRQQELGVSNAAIARQFRITRTNVAMIVKRKSWQHVA